MAQTWYIASDTQLYVFSLMLLAIVWKYEKKAKIIFGSTVVIGLATLASIAFCKNYDIIIRQYPENLYNMNGIKLEIWHDLYSSGYSNITGYTIGLIFGYIFYKNRKKSIEITKIHVILWWFLSFGMCNFIILIAATMYRPNYQNSTLESALYWALGKNIFALGIAIGIYGFALKIGWFARWLCEWKAVRVIGRLTYSTYIVHSTVIRIRGGLIRSPLYVNDYLLISTVLGDIALSYLVGTLMCLLFEMPVSALQKLLIPTTEHNRLTNSLKKPLNSKEVHLENENQNVGTNV
ncbi:uncharacterized protein LOC130441531 [Diorhabda sublineata]|uniref:uncharacterized protein LOC130441531 n=1 Tax=Diorhabda sublineata TaxID=1163346 RepID=UPI0024E0EC50|nr:uncharacterized protein LOC130441531 [Diorhabda sublineata]